jgi:hypothetical protein
MVRRKFRERTTRPRASWPRELAHRTWYFFARTGRQDTTRWLAVWLWASETPVTRATEPCACATAGNRAAHATRRTRATTTGGRGRKGEASGGVGHGLVTREGYVPFSRF